MRRPVPQQPAHPPPLKKVRWTCKDVFEDEIDEIDGAKAFDSAMEFDGVKQELELDGGSVADEADMADMAEEECDSAEEECGDAEEECNLEEIDGAEEECDRAEEEFGDAEGEIDEIDGAMACDSAMELDGVKQELEFDGGSVVFSYGAEVADEADMADMAAEEADMAEEVCDNADEQADKWHDKWWHDKRHDKWQDEKWHGKRQDDKWHDAKWYDDNCKQSGLGWYKSQKGAWGYRGTKQRAGAQIQQQRKVAAQNEGMFEAIAKFFSREDSEQDRRQIVSVFGRNALSEFAEKREGASSSVGVK